MVAGGLAHPGGWWPGSPWWLATWLTLVAGDLAHPGGWWPGSPWWLVAWHSGLAGAGHTTLRSTLALQFVMDWLRVTA